MPEDRTPAEDQIVALHEAGHAVVGAAVGNTLEEVTVEPGTDGEESYKGRASLGILGNDVAAHLLFTTAGPAAESLLGPKRRRRLTTFLRTEGGRRHWPEIRGAIRYLTKSPEGETIPPICSDRDEAVDLIRIAFRKSRALLEEYEDLVRALANRLQEERTLSKQEVRNFIPDDIWREAGGQAWRELNDERARLASDAA